MTAAPEFCEDLLNVFLYCNDIIIYLDNEKKITRLNPAAEKYLKIKKTNLLNKNFIDLCDRYHFLYPKILTKEGLIEEPADEVITTRCRDENTFSSISWQVIPQRHEHEINGYLLIGQDITNSVISENALQNVEERLNLFIDSVAGFHWWKDLQGRYLGCNQAIAKMLGLSSPQDIVGKTDYELPWMGNANSLRKHDEEVIRSGKMVTGEEIVLTKSNEELTFFVVKMPLKNDYGEIVGTVGSSIDITQIKRIQEALKIAKEKAETANRAKTAFIANMSHDIRTPLAGMIGIAEMLEKRGASYEDREYAHIIHSASERLLSLLNDILEVVSADGVRNGDLQLETFDLHERIHHIYELFIPNTETKHIHFELEIASDLPKYIISDRIKLDRILLNLVSNALKFTDEGTIKLKTKLILKDLKRPTIEFIVSDTGIGIAPEEITQIFNRFYRVAPSYRSKDGGYGIGLFIVKRFIESLSGRIKVDSELGKGTTFTVNLPVEIGKKEDVKVPDISFLPTQNKVKKAPVAKLPADRPIFEVKKNKFTILYIEDDNIARKTGQFFLESAGFNIVIVPSGETALKVAKSQAFDLILADVGLPGIDGNEFTLLFRHWEKKMHKQAIPIIGLSAHVTAETQVISLEAGMNSVMIKPLNAEKIASISSFLSGRDQSIQSVATETTSSTLAGYLGTDLPETEAELFNLVAYPLFDEKAGTEVSGSKEMLRELLTLLVEETIPEELHRLENAYKASDWSSIGQIAHKLKGATLYCGTVKMRYACQYLERYLLVGHHTHLEKLYQQLLQVLEETIQSVKNYR